MDDGPSLEGPGPLPVNTNPLFTKEALPLDGSLPINRRVACVMMRAMTEISPTAARSRRYRLRQRQGTMIVPVEADQDAIDALVNYAFLSETDMGDRAKVTDAIDLLLFMLSQGALEWTDEDG